MNARPYPLRVPENLMELVEAKAREERTDRATAMRRLLYVGAEEHVMGLIEAERVSVSRAAELLDMSPHRVRDLARKRGVPTGSTIEDHREARKAAGDLL